MRTFGFNKNTVFNWNEQAYKTVRINADSSVVIERLNDGQISVVQQDQLLKDYSKGRLVGNDEINTADNNRLTNQVFSRPLDDLPEKTKLEAKRRKHYIEAIYRDRQPIFTQEYLAPLISEAAIEIGDKTPPHVTTVYRWHKKYLTYRDTRSFIPRTDLRGSRGRKQNPIVYEILADVIQQLFESSPQTKKVDVYDELVWRVSQENKKLFEHEQLAMPSKRTVERLMSSIEVYDLMTLKKGKQAADKFFRLVKHKTITTRILERVEVDHTPLDLFLIDERTQLPLGRPTLTFIIDHFSRMILGYYISYQNPSTAAVMGAFTHAILPKETPPLAIPNLRVEHQWVCHGVPDLMVLDNGLEFHSNALESVAFDLGIRMEFCPKHEPRYKGTIERFLKTLNFSFASKIPGASYSKWNFREEYDPLKHALLTLGEFTHVLEKWILDIYAQQKHKGINTTPWEKWHEGLQSREVKLPMSLEDLKKRIGKVESRKLRRDGILLKGIRYQSDTLGRVLRKHGESVGVRVLYDPQDLGEIQVWPPNEDLPITVEALDQGYARGITEQQNERIQLELREQGNRSVNTEMLNQAKHDVTQQIQRLLESRHLKARKRGGRLSGVSSSKPEGSLSKVNPKNTKNLPKSSRKKPMPTKTNQLDRNQKLFPTFRLNKGEKNDC